MPSTMDCHFEIKKSVSEYNPYTAMTEEELLRKLENSRRHAEEGKYREADIIVSDIRAKYGV